MAKEKLVELLNWKLSSEMKMIKYRILHKDKEEIYSSAYEIDCKICIFELMKEMSTHMDISQIKACLQITGIIEFLYMEWLKISDSRSEELERSLWKFIKETEEKAA